MKPKKVLLLGSGALKIGEAGEFDYSGSQAIQALKQENIEIILINPNIATYQTSEGMASKVYFLPVTPYFVERVIKKEKPDSIILSFGGQTALNCGLTLDKSDILKKHRVRVLGTPVSSIQNTEDRDLFVKELRKIKVKVPQSIAVNSVKEALRAAATIGYPVMIRAAFSLGGKSSGVAHNKKELKAIGTKAFSSLSQILVEEYLEGWKEVEYEVVRDRNDNCVTICNMENLDPMGIHTGESIVVAPSQTLTNHEYHMLRKIAIRTIKHLGIVGECNIQYALSPDGDYRVIEVNARLSRSSALASKATGYPLAYIAAKLALGYDLTELENKVTRVTKACFEPALDYVVVKVPRWDLKKFKRVKKEIGSEMKSVGEVMAIGRSFEEALQKSIRMLGIGMHGLAANRISFQNLSKELKNPTDKRLLAIAESLRTNTPIRKIHALTHIDRWFLYKIKNITDTETAIKQHSLQTLPRELLHIAKKQGYSDFQIARLVIGDGDMDSHTQKIRDLRKKFKILPVVKQIDTLGAEYPAQTNYLYLTYHGRKDDISFRKRKSVIVLGGGAYRIGSSVEFDWCCVNAVLTLKKLGYTTIMVNYNPETVSTDYDMCDKLYFDELTYERIADIYEKERPLGVILSMGGQIPNNLSMRFLRHHVKVLGTPPKYIDMAENRFKFSRLLDKLGVDQPAWKELSSVEEAQRFSQTVGYPVLIRPSYVLSGAAMNVAFDEADLVHYLEEAADVNKDHPVVISKFVLGAKEIEIDAVAQNGNILVHAISEHVENAGVHSGDATLVLPPQNLYLETIRRIKKISRDIAQALSITGAFNIQFIAKDNHIKVIECNLRASRSFPFASKVFKVNFIDVATKAIMNKKTEKIPQSSLDLDYVGVKAPQFSFSRLKGADPTSSVEMTSTGEVACLGDNQYEAFLKALLAAEFTLPQKKTALISIGGEENRYKLLDKIRMLHTLGYTLYATEHTSLFIKRHGIRCKRLYKVHDKKSPNITDYIMDNKLGLIINVPNPQKQIRLDDTYAIRRDAVDYSVPLITNLQLAGMFIECLASLRMSDLEIKHWAEYR